MYIYVGKGYKLLNSSYYEICDIIVKEMVKMKRVWENEMMKIRKRCDGIWLLVMIVC